MEIQEKNVILAYSEAEDSGKKLLRTLFPSIDFDAATQPETRSIIERVTTFDEAVEELNRRASDGDELASQLLNDWEQLHESATPDLVAYIKLRIVCAALNEGWEPEFTEDEERWYPWHYLWTQGEIDRMSDEEKQQRALIGVDDYRRDGWAGFACSVSSGAPSYSDSDVGSRLCCKDEKTARHAATTFIRLWADFKLIRK